MAEEKDYVVIGVVVPPHLQAELLRRAKALQVSQATIIRWAVSQYLGVPLREEDNDGEQK